MFYLTSRKSEQQCIVGDQVMVLADFSGVPAGTKGLVSEIYDGGVMVAWIGLHNKTLGDILKAMISSKPMELSAARGFLMDGFAADEMGYLAFATEKHPKVDPMVFNPLIQNK